MVTYLKGMLRKYSDQGKLFKKSFISNWGWFHLITVFVICIFTLLPILGEGLQSHLNCAVAWSKIQKIKIFRKSFEKNLRKKIFDYKFINLQSPKSSKFRCHFLMSEKIENFCKSRLVVQYLNFCNVLLRISRYSRLAQ